MSLKTRKIATYLKPHAEQCLAELNQKLETNFALDIDWSIVTEADANSGWTEEEIKRSFYTTFFRPVERALESVWDDEVYREAIQEQVQTIKISPRTGMFLEIVCADATLHLNKILHSGNNPENDHMGSVAQQDIVNALESSLV